jgi:hypothetical protein
VTESTEKVKVEIELEVEVGYSKHDEAMIGILCLSVVIQ